MNPYQSIVDQPAVTATGQRAARLFSRYVGLFLDGAIPACIGRKLTQALIDADRQQRRQEAIAAAAECLDAGRGLSKHALAGLLSAELDRFESVGLRRVLSGSRPPSDLEKRLLVILQTDGPTSRDRLAKTLRGSDAAPSEK